MKPSVSSVPTMAPSVWGIPTLEIFVSSLMPSMNWD